MGKATQIVTEHNFTSESEDENGEDGEDIDILGISNVVSGVVTMI